MNNIRNNNNVIGSGDLYNQIMACSRKDKESEIKYKKIYYFYGTIGFTLPFIIEIFLRDPSITMSLIELECILFYTIAALVLLPIYVIILFITLRTGYYKFLFQLLPYLFLPLFYLELFILTFFTGADGLLYVISWIILVAYYIIVEYLNKNILKKPLFSNDKWEYYASTLLSYQALGIPDKQDGYSQRPVFTHFNEIKMLCPTFEDFKVKILEYIHFLAKRGELIGWKFEDKKTILYPRVLMNKYTYYLRIRTLYQLLMRMYTQQNLTAIIINYETEELSIKIMKEDYDELAEVNYYLISEQLAETVKKSIILHIQGHYEHSYHILYPKYTSELY